MRELALFAGSGGGILGGHLLGWKTVAACEIEDYPRETLLRRQADGILPRFPIWDDVSTFDGYPFRGRVDIITGGFPCQDISVAGKGAGIYGERSGLWKEMRRIIGEVRPSLALMENSPLLTARGLGTVLGDLAEIGYDAEWCVLGGSAVGNVCEGERIWILAFKADRPVLESVDIPPFDFSYSKESFRRKHTGAISEMLSQDDYSILKRNADDVAEGMDRLKAIGNGQVPAVAAVAFLTLYRRITE